MKHVLAYEVKSKHCNTYSYYQRLGQPAPEHQCYKNWDGSSKRWRPAAAGAELIAGLESEGARCSVLIMDDDAITIAKVQDKLDHPVEKWSDLNHTKKHLGNSLYALQKKHKCLTTEVIKYLQRCFSYAVHQSKGDAAGLKKALGCIVPHVFGQHENCGVWCQALREEDYIHKSLPRGEDLSREQLETDLSNIFSTLSRNVETIASAATKMEVESMNTVYTSKAPKCLIV